MLLAMVTRALMDRMPKSNRRVLGAETASEQGGGTSPMIANFAAWGGLFATSGNAGYAPISPERLDELLTRALHNKCPFPEK